MSNETGSAIPARTVMACSIPVGELAIIMLPAGARLVLADGVLLNGHKVESAQLWFEFESGDKTRTARAFWALRTGESSPPGCIHLISFRAHGDSGSAYEGVVSFGGAMAIHVYEDSMGNRVTDTGVQR